MDAIKELNINDINYKKIPETDGQSLDYKLFMMMQGLDSRRTTPNHCDYGDLNSNDAISSYGDLNGDDTPSTFTLQGQIQDSRLSYAASISETDPEE